LPDVHAVVLGAADDVLSVLAVGPSDLATRVDIATILAEERLVVEVVRAHPRVIGRYQNLISKKIFFVLK